MVITVCYVMRVCCNDHDDDHHYISCLLARVCPLSHEARFCSASPPPFVRHVFFSCFYRTFYFPVPIPAFTFDLVTWVQPSHPASPRRPSSVPGSNLIGWCLPTDSSPSALWVVTRYASVIVWAVTVVTNYFSLVC